MLLIERRLGIPLMGVVDWIAGTSTGSIIALVLAQGTVDNSHRNLPYSSQVDLSNGHINSTFD